MELMEILAVAMKGGASDVHLKVGLPPLFRLDGVLIPLKDAARLSPEDAIRVAQTLMNAEQREQFLRRKELDFAYVVPNLGRFRVNVFMQRQFVGVVLRIIPLKVSSIQQLHLPSVIEKVAMEQRGLILVTGATGSGKSTTLAAMLDHINSNRSCHVLTVEDPIEFVYKDKRAIINQREVGTDTSTFATGLRAALRQDPDVIMVGEMRDMETIETAIHAAETGHLVLSTLHTVDAGETLNRIIGVFPPHQQAQVRVTLASIIKAVICQRLVPRADKRGRVAAMEIMLNSGRIRELIGDPTRHKEITDAIARSHQQYAMQTFDQSLYQLVKDNLVTYEEALKQATNPDDFALRMSGVSTSDDWESNPLEDGPGGRSSLH